jgi:hypothetical protein
MVERGEIAGGGGEVVIKKIITRKAIMEGEKIPTFYGVAYRDFAMMQAVCYPIPLNWVVRWGRELYFRLSNPETNGLEDAIHKAYGRGFDNGVASARYDIEQSYHRGLSDAAKQLDKTLKEYFTQ